MDREKLKSFAQTAEVDLTSVRSSLLIAAQIGDACDLSVPRQSLARLRSDSESAGYAKVVDLSITALEKAENLGVSVEFSPANVYSILDIVAEIEAAVWDIPSPVDDFESDIDSFVDAIFDDLMLVTYGQSAHPVVVEEKFEIDDETLDIFRAEADELLSNIAADLNELAKTPGDQHVLWNIRRNAHTFKGAAGIVGHRHASETAHRMEDLLDKMVEMECEAVPQVLRFLNASTTRLVEIVSSREASEISNGLDKKYQDAMEWLSSSIQSTNGTDPQPNANPEPLPASSCDTPRSTTTPIVRVSLARLDELIKLSNSLLVNRSDLAEEFAEIKSGPGTGSESLDKLGSLFEAQRNLIDDIQAKLLRIRMVKFGTLETRLSRAVHVTSVDENKKAELTLVNGEVEIDTQVIDALIEPLLHLLKNAVVHGIESPDTRRLLGKPERGEISITLETDDQTLEMSVADDGAGISAQKIKEKAVANGILTSEQAANLSDQEAFNLIFDRGLTTAEKIDLNAGRGVGMSIVKESVENRGGTVVVESLAQHGTTVRIEMPLIAARSEISPGTNQEAKQSTEDSKRPLALIVDDSASIRRQSTTLVQNAGLRVITATNGAEALELMLAGDWVPDLILSDVEMPQIDGWEFLAFVKTDDLFGPIPVVMVTSLDAPSHRKRACDLGAADFINKPLNPENIEQILRKLGIKALS
ncbi:MAG: response regulator [Pyrinomonadaceae bacterium]